MKKFFTVVMLVASILVGCAQKSSKVGSEVSAADGDQKILVAYFSATGTTRAVAEQLACEANATLFEIVPEQPYTPADLDWTNDASRSSMEMKDKEHSRPAIATRVEDIDQYEVIFVGFPIWWYTCPTIINTFLESYNLEGKTIIPFATSGGSPIEPCVADMEKSASGAIFKAAKLLNHTDPSELKRWIEEVVQ